jgi:alpha-1,6-mannosyltransferase
LAFAGLARARAHDWELVIEQLAARYRQAIREHGRVHAPGTLFAPPQPS